LPLSHGYRRKTRAILRKSPKDRGKSSLSRILYEYRPGDKVIINIDPSIHKGMPHRRYHGKVGVIVAKRGRAYEVSVTQGDAAREIIVRPEHMKPLM